MNKTQEDMFEKSYAEDPIAVSGIKENQRIGWAACLEANGIGKEPRIREGGFTMTPDQQQKCTIAYEEFRRATCLGQEDTVWGYFSEGYRRALETVALLEEDSRIPEGYFKIGEEVEYRKKGDKDYEFGTIGIYGPFDQTIAMDKVELIRRILAWKPKDGEVVFALDDKDRVHVATIKKIEPRADGYNYGVLCQDGNYSLWRLRNLKPFDASKIGKPWSEL